MRKVVLLVGVALVGGLGWLGWTLWKGTIVVALGPRELQAALEPAFPVEKTHLSLVKVDLRNPVVALSEGSDRFGLSVKLGLAAPPLPRWDGAASISCRIRYDAARGAFFADDPVIDRLEVAEHPGQDQTLMRTALTWVVKGTLDHTPLYTLATGQMGDALARLVLKDVRVRDGKLLLTVGMGAEDGKN